MSEEYQPRRHGFTDLVAVPWYEPEAFVRAAQDLAGAAAARLAADGHPGFGLDAAGDLCALRLALSPAEQADLRALGADAADALQQALAAWRPGERDLDIAARVAARLESRGADAPVLIVGGDDRVGRFRHPMAAGAPVRRLAMAVVVARRGGLHVAATRFAAAGRPDPEFAALRARVLRIEPGRAGRVGAAEPVRGRADRAGPAATPGRAHPAAGQATTRAARSATRSASSRSPRASGTRAGGARRSRTGTRWPGTPACPAAPRPRTPTW